MRKRRFPAGVEATEEDFNALHDGTEEALRVFIRALASSNADGDSVLFKRAEPTSVGSGPWTVTVPPQFFAINGVLGELPATNFDVAASANRTVGLFLRVKRSNIVAQRAFLDLSGDGPARGVGPFAIEVADAAELTVVDPYTGSSDDPTQATNDAGPPLKLATMAVTGVGGTPELDVAAFDPDGRLWLFPAGTPPTDHAASHLPGGGDAIQFASPVQPGLISEDDLATVRSALTDLTVGGGSPFLARTIAGDNEGTPKTAALDLRLSQALKSTLIDAQQKLDLNYLSGPSAGVSARPARSDHKHTLTDSPIVVATRLLEITVPAGELGQSHQITLPESFGAVVSVSVRWLAPGITAPYLPLVDAPWSLVSVNGILRRVGARYTVSGPNRIELQLGADALCEMTEAELILVLAATGSVNWDTTAGSNGLLPRTGRLLITAVGVRSGLPIPQ